MIAKGVLDEKVLQKAYVFVLLYQAVKVEQRLLSFASYGLHRLMEKCKCVTKRWEEGRLQRKRGEKICKGREI